MNKRIFAIIAILLVAVLAVSLTACNKGGILDSYNNIGNAKTATQTVSVKNGNLEIASATLMYDFAAKTLTGERKFINDLNESEAWTTEAVNETLSGGATAKLSKDTVKDLKENGNSATCKVANADIKNVFGINAADVKGDVTLELTAANGNLSKLVVTYTSVNNNLVTVTTTFAY
ncbi:MAG: hypothetical protein NC132_03500 [Corallococcus sp.]|nr:hypothetical protein [Corallococcus sp.]MCM1359567.1 hypothetical protein [Corallococcus sp.]MCM1395159.1 hypothetical protein [Corallococcus sp.]